MRIAGGLLGLALSQALVPCWSSQALPPQGAEMPNVAAQSAAPPARPASAPSATTLAQALDAAWARHPQALALVARQAQAQAVADQAGAITPGPAAVSVSQLSDRLINGKGRQEWEVEVATPMWLPGQRTARGDAAARGAAEVEASAAVLHLQLAGEVRVAWWAVAAAREALGLARQRVATAQALSASVQRRFKAGDLARIDANLAQAEELAAQAEELDAESALRQVTQAYRVLTGLDAPANLPPEATHDVVDASAHPQLQAAQASAALAASRLAVVDASHREAPELALRWNSQRGDAIEPYSQGLGIKLTLPFSSGARVRQDGAQARAELVQADAEVAMAQARVQQEEGRAQTELGTVEKQRALARMRRALSADSLQLAQRSFDLGESDLPALMRARAAAHESESAFQRQEVAHFAAMSRLYQAQGVLP